MTKTHWGLNPSYASWALGRLPLFADPMRRGKLFEKFTDAGVPTGEPSPLGHDGWPVPDGGWHGVRLFGDMGGTLPELMALHPGDTQLRINPGEAAFFSWRTTAHAFLKKLKPAVKGWHLPSFDAFAYFKPKVLRTLDWGYQARKEKRPDWTRPRVVPEDPLQGEEMAVELHAEAANLLSCALWWNAPPRFALSVVEYEVRLTEYLTVIRCLAEKPPILEYGNELWNAGFPVHNWLRGFSSDGRNWHKDAATEIAILKRVANRVFGEPGPLGEKTYYLFVGGHIGDSAVLDKILGALDFTPDLAGPAIYMQPLKADQERWRTNNDPTQADMRASVMANMPQFRAKLDAHRLVLATHGVPYFACYEVGQDMHARGDAYKRAALQAQREAWMGDAYRECRTMIQDAGVGLACWYSAASAQTLDRSFGLLESTDVTSVLPKARAARGDQ